MHVLPFIPVPDILLVLLLNPSLIIVHFGSPEMKDELDV